MKLHPDAIKLIIQFEVGGGKEYYSKFLARPSWPGGASGVTIGIGYDLGYSTNFVKDWTGKLDNNSINRLARTIGLKGSRAQAARSGVRDIVVPWEMAMQVFEETTLPQYINETLKAFPKSEFLPPQAFGALVSLVFNRGASTDNSDRRREMRQIKTILQLGNDNVVDNDDIKAIAKQIKSMARLWPDNSKSDNDLHDRRLKEAALVLKSIS